MSQISEEAIQRLVVQREKTALALIRSAVEHLHHVMNGHAEVSENGVVENVGMTEPAWLSRVTDLLGTIESEIG